MPFVVAAPAAFVAVFGGLWYLLVELTQLDARPAVRFAGGVVFGLGAFVVLAASANAPLPRVVPPRWSRSVLLGLLCAAALWLVGAAAFDGRGWLIALTGGLACVVADRRTAAGRREQHGHKAMLVLVMLAVAERVFAALFVDRDAYSALGILFSVLVAVFLPIERFQRWSALLLPTTRERALRRRPQELDGYREEVLALAAFLDPADIPKSLVVAAAQAAGPGQAASLRSLAQSAITELGADSLNVVPIAQDFARRRMLAEERREWAGRAVRMLTDSFPEDYRDQANWPWCERLLPHAVAAAGHAEELDVARGAAALLLDRAGGYLAERGRREQAREVTAAALRHASAGFGDAAPEVALLHGRLSRLDEPGNVTVDIPLSDAARVVLEDSNDRSALAFHHASLGDTRRDGGDVTGARRHYTMALAHARAGLGRKHPLVPELRARLDALPSPTRAESDERRLVLGCLSLVVAAVLICVGIVVVRDLDESGMAESDETLADVSQLAQMCAPDPVYFPDAARFGGPAPHPVHVFRRSHADAAFQREPYSQVETTAQSTQLVGCAVQTHTGPPITVCMYPDQPRIPLHQATYVLTVYETRTGKKVGSQTITAGSGQCPPSYVAPGEDKPWMLYAGPTNEQYRQALIPIEDTLGAQPTSEVN